MNEDRERWNKRFGERPMLPSNAPSFIRDCFKEIETGTVIDIASGDGAAALYLAEKGLEVTATDISDVALTRLLQFARDRNADMRVCQADLDDPKSLTHLAQFDYVVITHFKPKIEYWPVFVALLKPGGQLFLSTFNWLHHLKNNFSRRFCLEEKELINISDGLALEYHASVERRGDYMDDYQFRRA